MPQVVVGDVDTIMQFLQQQQPVVEAHFRQSWMNCNGKYYKDWMSFNMIVPKIFLV